MSGGHQSLFWKVLAASFIFAATNSVSASLASPSTTPKVYAHRGGSKWAPENSMAAFRKCVDNGVYGIELDIQQCKSGELVVIHDEDLKRTTDGVGFVKDKTFAEISKLDSGSWFDKQYKDEKIPQLSDVLKLLDGKVVLNIEIKNTPIAYPGIEDELLKVLKDYPHPQTIIISSFDHEVLKRLHDKSSKYAIALLGDPILCDVGNYAKQMGATAWHPYYGSMRKDVIDAAHKGSLKVNVWTPNQESEWQSLVSQGVDGIVTDDPKGLTEFLKKQDPTVR
ncbi:MAG: glycerophosphodiester phosphodiesterase [Leptolyngbya sp.]|nr:glycerophosphodiester phosphodiesterase [Candidatus Melainabacteria bacterium]